MSKSRKFHAVSTNMSNTIHYSEECIQKNVCGYIMKHLFLESLMQIIHETALKRANVFDYEVIIPF